MDYQPRPGYGISINSCQFGSASNNNVGSGMWRSMMDRWLGDRECTQLLRGEGACGVSANSVNSLPVFVLGADHVQSKPLSQRACKGATAGVLKPAGGIDHLSECCPLRAA